MTARVYALSISLPSNANEFSGLPDGFDEGGKWRERKRERETERQRDRETERQRERETERHNKRGPSGVLYILNQSRMVACGDKKINMHASAGQVKITNQAAREVRFNICLAMQLSR